MEREKIAEDYEENYSEEGWAQPIIAEVEMKLKMVDKRVCSSWKKEDPEVLKRRIKFCENYEGFDKVCDCK